MIDNVHQTISIKHNNKMLPIENSLNEKETINLNKNHHDNII